MAGTFQCDPTERLARAIPRIFESEGELTGDVFMSRLADTCPELDGGEIFRAANGDLSVRGKTMTTGLAQALVNLHLDGVIILNCPPDSPGWDLGAASPSNDGRTLRSNRIDSVEWRANAKQRAAARRGVA
jgi:hypothetical protein